MDKRTAVGWIDGNAANEIPAHYRNRFIEVAETELSSLHEGNIARYHIRPAGFLKWKLIW